MGAVALAATSPAHFTLSQLPSASPEISLCSVPTFDSKWDLGSSRSPDCCLGPETTCRWFSLHIGCSVPATSDRTHPRLIPMPLLLLSVAGCGPDVSVVVYVLLLPITQLFNLLEKTTDRWQVDPEKLFFFPPRLPKHGGKIFTLEKKLWSTTMNHQKALADWQQRFNSLNW